MKINFNYIINFTVNIILFLFNIFKILINILTIKNAEIIIFQNRRVGFGNIFTSTDLARKIFPNKKILYISFYDRSRFHNKKIFDFLCEKKIFLYTSIFLSKRKVRYGEYDIYPKNPNKNIFQNKLIYIIKKLHKKKSSTYDIVELYDYATQKIQKRHLKKFNFKSQNHQWLSLYYYLVEKKPKLIINNKNEIINNLIKGNSDKKICIYKREKKIINKYTKNFNLFYDVIKILYKKKYKIFLVGEYFNLLKKYPKISSMVSVPEKNGLFNKDLNLAMQLVSDYYFGDTGGGSHFSMYKKKSVILGKEIGHKFPNNVKIFNYRIFYKKKEIKIDSKTKKYFDEKIKLFKTFLDVDDLYKLNFTVKNEHSNKILKYIKNNF